MTIRLACPACGQQQTVAHDRGRFSCRHCQQALVVRRRQAVWQELIETVPPRSRRKQPVSRLLAAGVLAGLGLIAGILLAVALTGDKELTRPEQTAQLTPARPAVPRSQMPGRKFPWVSPPKKASATEESPEPLPKGEEPPFQLSSPEESPPPTPVAGEKPLPSPEGPVTVDATTRILLPPVKLQDLRKKAAANTPTWRAFKARLDRDLNEIARDAYQGSQLAWISDYALGYLILKDRDPATAARYADKAIAYLKSALRDYQKGGTVSRQFLTRGDGQKRTFTLPHNHILAPSLRVYLAPVVTTPVKRSATGQDPIPYGHKILKVSNSADGPADYGEGVDWRYNRDLLPNVIDWLSAGKKPAAGATYCVTTTTGYSAPLAQATLRGNTIALTAPATAAQAVYVEYIHGVHAADGSTLAYQQTSAGDGGFNSLLVDTTYTSRYLGKHVATGLDWLDGYAGLDPALRTEAMAMLVRWSDYIRDSGYFKDSPASNYGIGGYVSRVMTALALAHRHPAGPRLLAEVVAWRKKYVLPLLTNDKDSLKGGFWPEGWSYGALAVQNLLLSAVALEVAGSIPNAAAERRWAGEAVQHLVSAQSAAGTVYDGGDFFAYPAPFPGKELFYLLAAVTSDPALRSYANYVLQKYSAKPTNDHIELLFDDPAAPAAFWSSLPLEHHARGTGLLVARSDWGGNPTWVSFQLGNLLAADHQSNCPGQVQIKRGRDDLLINANAPGKNQANQHKSKFGNLVVVDDNGDKMQVYPFSMGVWYGKPGVVTRACVAGKDHVYVAGDYRAAYSSNTRPGDGGPVTELTRQLVYLRPDYVVVYDRVATRKDTHVKELRWHFLTPPRVDGNAFEVSAGQSKLFGRTFSSVPLTTTGTTAKVGDASVAQLSTRNAAPVGRVCYLTAFQVAPASAGKMDAAERVVSTDSRREGIRIGNRLVLFGRDGGKGAGAIAYRVAAAGQLHHLITDLHAGRKYQVRVNGSLQSTLSATPQGTLTFTAKGEVQAIEVRQR